MRGQAGELWDVHDDAERRLYAQLLSTFVEQAPDALAAVEDAFRDADPAAVERAAHRLRGAAATLGAGPLAQLCGTVEDAARTGQLPAPAPVFAALRREVGVTCTVFTELAGELSGMDGTPAPS